MSHWIRFLGWPLLCGVLAGLLIARGWSPPASGPTPSYAVAVQSAAPAVVNIYTSRTLRAAPLAGDPVAQRLLDQGDRHDQERIQRSLGSGVVVDARGYILTNHHVIAGADEIRISLYDGREALARLVGVDPETDLAALKVDLDALEPITIGDPASARVGDVVLAIGNPYGFGQSVTQGIISAVGRYGLQLATYENYIQTDAAINPGNSGGALVDVAGRLLGVNAAIYTPSGGSAGIGLAVPVDLAIRTMHDLIDYGRPLRGWLGVEVQPLPAVSTTLAGRNGVVVTAVYENGPGDRGGLRPGDVVVAIEGRPVGDGHAGLNLIGKTRPGDRIAMEVYRQGEKLALDVTLGARPVAPTTSG